MVHVCNPLDVIQEILLDDAFPAGSLFLQKKGQSAREFEMLHDSPDFNSTQTLLRGHEALGSDATVCCRALVLRGASSQLALFANEKF